MKAVVTAIGTNHFFHMAAQLERHRALAAIFTGYPLFKLKGVGVPPERIHSFPWFQTAYMAKGRLGLNGLWLDRQLCHLANRTLDRHVAKCVPPCDVFIGQSNCSLLTGRVVQSRGGKYVVDRPCAHIRVQDRLLRGEYERRGVRYAGIDPRIVEREEMEYAEADAVLVASTFAKESFLEMGFPAEKVWKVPYGVDTSRFQPTGEPRFEDFTILFVGNLSFQKGIPDLLEAFDRLDTTPKRLVLAGAINPEVRPMLSQAQAKGGVEVLGPRPGAEIRSLMSRSHVLVLPSIQDGFGMVMAEALACGTPVIASRHTGGADLFEDGKGGFLVPPGDPGALAEALRKLQLDPEAWRFAADSALSAAAQLGDWNTYGDLLMAHATSQVAVPKAGVA